MIDLEKFGALLRDLKNDTEINDHTEARLRIANFFEMPRFIRYFTFLIAGRDATGYMPHWAIEERTIHTNTMMSYLLDMHGEEVRRRVWECL